MKPTVAIVYLSYQSEPYLKEVTASLVAQTYPKEQVKVIIVDNASQDQSDALIRKDVLPRSGDDLPEVIYLPQTENTGFSVGCNIGIERALLEGVDYVYLLNNDAKLHPQAIEEAVFLSESDQTIGSVQSLMCLWQDEEVINSTGGMVHWLGFGFVRDNGKKRSEIDVQDGEEIAYASGAAVLYRAEALQKVGLLDPYYFLYHEDLELGWRLRLAGYKNVLSTKSVCYHYYEFKRSITKFFWMERNRGLVFGAHLSWRSLFLLLPFLWSLEFALILFALKGGWIREKLLVYQDWLLPKTWRHLRQKRAESAAIRQVSDQEIMRLFTGRILHQETSSPFVDSVVNPVLDVVFKIVRTFIK